MSKLEYKRNQETQKGIGTQGSEDEKAVGVAWGGGAREPLSQTRANNGTPDWSQ